MKRSLSLALVAASLILPSLAIAQNSAESASPQPQFSLEQKMLLRCSVALALTAEAQKNGDAAAAQHPPLAERGNEFFVRSLARVMDEANLDRTQVIAQVVSEREELLVGEMLEQVMPACLQLLNQSGL